MGLEVAESNKVHEKISRKNCTSVEDDVSFRFVGGFFCWIPRGLSKKQREVEGTQKKTQKDDTCSLLHNNMWSNERILSTGKTQSIQGCES